ncbi:hypothetical protein U1Q18_005637 [Sarracenia purpurea var. burkii]
MPELGFEDQSRQRSVFSPPDVSPDSVIFAVESAVSLYSSADRCSFADIQEVTFLTRCISIHSSDDYFFFTIPRAKTITKESLGLSACAQIQETYREKISACPDSDPKKYIVQRNSPLTREIQKAKGHKEDGAAEIGDKNGARGSARNSSSQALEDCQGERYRSEVLSKNPSGRGPASLDLNSHITNGINSSLRFGVMKKSSVITRQTGMFMSPETPNCRHINVGILKGWSSERVPLRNNSSQRHVSAALLPFNGRKTLPSKWEDAERWIFSPVSGDGVVKPSFHPPQRRPKSKSGPLGPPGIPYYSLHSPLGPMIEAANVGNLMARSPLSAGVIAEDGFSIPSGLGGGASRIFPTCMEPCMARSVSVHGCSQLLSQSSLPSSQGADEKHISRAVSRRDMATQMSPDGSPHSSPWRRPSFSLSSSSVLPIVELGGVQSSILEVRDVQVDERVQVNERVTLTRWSKKHRVRFLGKDSENVDDRKKKAVEVRSSAWEVSEAERSISKTTREEAKITAWENLQKAKAEAAIRKLEMKLEKRRSLAMDTILNKLRSAQKKAQKMRSLVSNSQSRQIARTSHKVISFQRTRQLSSLSGCFACHAF